MPAPLQAPPFLPRTGIPYIPRPHLQLAIEPNPVDPVNSRVVRVSNVLNMARPMLHTLRVVDQGSNLVFNTQRLEAAGVEPMFVLPQDLGTDPLDFHAFTDMGQRGSLFSIVPSRTGMLDFMTISRAQTSGARSTGIAADGVTWIEYGPDEPRLFGTEGMKIEGQRTNSIRNPRAEGAGPPTNWYLFTNVDLTAAYSFGATNGIRHVDVRVFGTASGAGATDIGLETVGAIPVVNGQVWTQSLWSALVGGSLANIASVNLRAGERDTTNEVGASVSPASTGPLLQRSSITRTISPAGTNLVPTIRITTAGAGAVEATFRIWMPQLELGPFASTPILPAVGALVASTRGGDIVSATLASLGIGANGVCTILGTFMTPQAAADTGKNLFEINDNTGANRFLLRNEIGTTDITVWRVLALAGSPAIAGILVPGTAFRAGISIDGTGRASASINGAAVVSVSGGPVNGLLTLVLGNSSSVAEALFGDIDHLRVLPYGVSDEVLRQLVADLPV